MVRTAAWVVVFVSTMGCNTASVPGRLDSGPPRDAGVAPRSDAGAPDDAASTTDAGESPGDWTPPDAGIFEDRCIEVCEAGAPPEFFCFTVDLDPVDCGLFCAHARQTAAESGCVGAHRALWECQAVHGCRTDLCDAEHEAYYRCVEEHPPAGCVAQRYACSDGGGQPALQCGLLIARATEGGCGPEQSLWYQCLAEVPEPFTCYRGDACDELAAAYGTCVERL